MPRNNYIGFNIFIQCVFYKEEFIETALEFYEKHVDEQKSEQLITLLDKHYPRLVDPVFINLLDQLNSLNDERLKETKERKQEIQNILTGILQTTVLQEIYQDSITWWDSFTTLQQIQLYEFIWDLNTTVESYELQDFVDFLMREYKEIYTTK